MMSSSVKKQTYALSITVPVFGRIPLHPRDMLNDLRIKENPPLWAQFLKYGICGILSVIITFAVVLYVQSQWPDYLNREVHSTASMQVHMSIVLASAFIPSNFFAYFTNRLFVFTPGKHSFLREATFFTVISALSFAGGEIGKRIMIDLHFHPLIATASFAISSALVNFIARKCIIFKN